MSAMLQISHYILFTSLVSKSEIIKQKGPLWNTMSMYDITISWSDTTNADLL